MTTMMQPNRQTGRATRTFARTIEEHGIAIRQKAGLGRWEQLDPFALQASLNIVIADPRSLGQLTKEDHEQLPLIDARTWSGGAKELPDGRLLVVLNPNQTRERAVVTVMEEVAHAHIGHQPSPLSLNPDQLAGRSYDQVAEKEAYGSAAAALLPSVVVARAVWHSMPAENLSIEYGVSVELVEFRIKTLRLWPWYRDNRAAA